ncbi:two-component regulator propeller domain-containing protein [Arcticibacter sp.]|uniref:hybrid sensor histidine kinase/response regulator transcription factor n=1 Tax=Arcticibacter sp. TaxID=1872630 RepID=UPI00388FD427
MTTRTLGLLLRLIILFLTPFRVFSQETNLNFINLSSKEGLSSNVVNTIHKDSFGYMWFGSDDGLNRFDGQQFTVYRHKGDDSSSIASNEILTIHEDRSRNLWIGTGSGLVLYNRKMDSFKNYRETKNMAITSISSDGNGDVWVAGYGGLYILSSRTGLMAPIKFKRKEDGEAIRSQPIMSMFRDRHNRMWLGTRRGLYLYQPRQDVLLRFLHSNEPSSLSGNSVSAISEDVKGNIWVGTNSGLSVLKLNGKEFINYHHVPSNKNSLSSNIVYAIAPEQDGKLWIGTENGLNILDPATGDISRVEHDGRSRFSLIGKSVKSIFIDRQGVYWVATFRGGVNKYDKNLAFFNLRQSNRFDPAGLSASVVTSFVEAGRNRVYVGTDGGGLNLFNSETGVFQHISLGEFAPNALSILAMEKRGSEVWIGTYLNGLFVFDTKTGESRHIKSGDGPHNISGSDIFCMKADSRGNVWIGTNGQGVDCFDGDRKNFIHFNKLGIARHRIQLNGYIRAIEEDREGNIWIGSNGSGIAVYNPLNQYTKLLNKGNTDLPTDNINCITAARDGRVWIGSMAGLSCYDLNANKVVTFSEDDGLSNGVVYKILEDENGKVWVSTNKGISSFDPATKRFKNYSSYNGVQRSPFVMGAGLRLSDGRLFFGGTDGFNYFHPKDLYANKSVPKVVLTDLKISNQTVKPSEDSPVKEDISVAEVINLDYKQNFSLSFVALNYTSPRESRYSYKLENFDKEWNVVGQSNTAIYTNLDPGEYVFYVKATSDTGEWTTPVKSIKIVVHSPFWLTYYAYAFYLLVIGSVLVYVRRMGIRKLKDRFAREQERIRVQQMIEQERRESERLREFDQLKIKFLTNLSHEFRTPISLIVGPVEQLIQQETNSPRNQQLQMIKRNSRRLLNLVNQLLDFRNIKEKEQKLHVTERDFVAFVREVAESFKDLADRKRINFSFSSEVRSYFTTFDANKIERIFFNLLSNAFKFTLEGGEISLKIREGEGLHVSLSDSGIGMKEEEQERIFERFFQTETDGSVINQGSGIGLSIAKEFVKLHGGTIQVNSVAGKGSIFTVHLPLSKIPDTSIPDDDIAEEGTLNNSISETATTATTLLPTILLVEDNEDFRFYLKDNLSVYYRVVEASNGKDGWQKVLSAHPQLVVSDISMPHVSGTELCKKIKADRRTNHIPVILLTALTGEDNQLIGLGTGASDYMTKPFNFEILHIKIRNLLAQNQQLKSTYSKQVKIITPEPVVASDNEKFLEKILQYIEDNLTSPQLSVEELSKHMGMSRGSLYSKVLETTAETPVEFIRSVKLDKAAVLLEKSDMNVGQICYSVGFATPNYFARAFKAKFDMLPSEYILLKRRHKAVHLAEK